MEMSELQDMLFAKRRQACASWDAGKRRERFPAVSSPVIVILNGGDPDRIKEFFAQMIRRQEGVYFLTLGATDEEAGAIATGTETQLEESVERMMEDINQNGGIFRTISLINIVFVLDAHEPQSQLYRKIAQTIQESLPKRCSSDFYLCCTYNELLYDEEKLRQAAAFLQDVSQYIEEGSRMTVASLGIRKQNGRMDGTEEAKRERMNIICFFILLLSQQKLSFCKKDAVYALGIARQSGYTGAVWDALFLDLAGRLISVSMEKSEGTDSKVETDLESLVKSADQQIDVSMMEYALMNPVTAISMDRKYLNEVEKAAFGRSLQMYFQQTEALVREEMMEKTDRFLESELETACATKEDAERFMRIADRLTIGLDCVENINYSLVFSQEFSFTEDQVRQFVIKNIYEPKARAAENQIKKEILMKIKRCLDSIEKGGSRKDLLWDEVQNGVDLICGEADFLPLYNPIDLEHVVTHIRSDLSGMGFTDPKAVLSLICAEVEKLMDPKTVREVLEYEDNFQVVCADMREKMAPYCVELSDETHSTVSCFGWDEEKNAWDLWERLGEGGNECFEYFRVPCLSDVWAITSREIRVSNLEFIALEG